MGGQGTGLQGPRGSRGKPAQEFGPELTGQPRFEMDFFWDTPSMFSWLVAHRLCNWSCISEFLSRSGLVSCCSGTAPWLHKSPTGNAAPPHLRCSYLLNRCLEDHLMHLTYKGCWWCTPLLRRCTDATCLLWSFTTLKVWSTPILKSFGNHRRKIKRSVSVPPLVVFVDSDLKIKMRGKKDKLLEWKAGRMPEPWHEKSRHAHRSRTMADSWNEIFESRNQQLRKSKSNDRSKEDIIHGRSRTTTQGFLSLASVW